MRVSLSTARSRDGIKMMLRDSELTEKLAKEGLDSGTEMVARTSMQEWMLSYGVMLVYSGNCVSIRWRTWGDSIYPKYYSLFTDIEAEPVF